MTKRFDLSNLSVLLAGVLLTLMILAAYSPTLVFSVNPLPRESGLEQSSSPGLVGGQPVIDPNDGTTTQALGKASADSWLRGSVPWWNYYSGVGLPLAGEMQPASLFLPFVLLLHFSNGVVLLRVCLQLLGGIGTFVLLNRMKLKPIASLLGAVLFCFNGCFSWFQHASIFPLPFLPFTLLGVELEYQAAACGQKSPISNAGSAIIALSIGLSLYSGFPETAYCDGLLAVVWLVARVAAVSSKTRIVFLFRTFCGSLLGIALAAPALLPFFEYLGRSASSHSSFGNAVLPPGGLLPAFLPYIYGPLQAFNGIGSMPDLPLIWGNIGGYVGLTAFVLACIALFHPTDRGFRLSLALWAALVLARTVGAAGSLKVFHFLPANDIVAIFRYAPPSAEMAVIVLASLGVNDWLYGVLRKSAVIGGSLLAMTIVSSAAVMGSPLITSLLSAGRVYRKWLYGSAGFGCIVVAALVAVLLKPSTRLRQASLLVVAAVEALLFFIVPLLSGHRHSEIDTHPITFLKSHLGLNRVFSVGPISPNYSAYFSLSAINHISLPVDGEWAGYLRRHFDPAIDGTNFSGTWPPPAAARLEQLRTHVHTLESLGVKYVITPANNNPFVRKWRSSHAPTGNFPLNLGDNQSIEGELSIPAGPSGRVSELGIVMGSYGGAATGDISVQLCQHSICSDGSRSMAGAVDNQSFTIPLRQPLPISSPSILRYSVRYTNGRHAAAVWVWPTQGTQRPLKSSFRSDLEYIPELALGFETGTSGPHRVFHDSVADIYELARSEPYFSVIGGTCDLQSPSRDSARLSCLTKARLLRRELFYPGWRSFIDGQSEQAVQREGIFQAVELPPGSHTLSFHYAPVNSIYAFSIALISVASLTTLTLTGLGLLKTGSARRRL